VSFAAGLQIAWYYHLPAVSSDAEVDDLVEASLIPLLQAHALTRRKFVLAVTGTLLDRMATLRPEVVGEIAGLSESGLCHVAGTTYHEVYPPIVPARFLRLHVERDRDTKVRLIGHAPTVFYPPNFTWTFVLGWTLLGAGYRAVILDDDHYRAATATQLWRWTVDRLSRLETVMQETVVDHREVHRPYRYLVPGRNAGHGTPLMLYFRDSRLVRRLSFGTSGALHSPLEVERVHAVAREISTLLSSGGRITIADDGDRINPVSLAGYRALLEAVPAADTVSPSEPGDVADTLAYLPSYSIADQWGFWLSDIDSFQYVRALEEIYRLDASADLDAELLELQDVFFLFWKTVPRKAYYLERLRRIMERRALV
jgi:hypothetical protein